MTLHFKKKKLFNKLKNIANNKCSVTSFFFFFNDISLIRSKKKKALKNVVSLFFLF